MSENWSGLSETLGKIFGGLEYGVDIATTAAISVSAGLFLYNLHAQNKSAKKLSLNKAIRSAALSELTVSIRKLSHLYQAELGQAGMTLSARSRSFYEKFPKDKKEDPTKLHLYSEFFDQAVKDSDQIMEGSINFAQVLSAEMYVVFGLLDSFEDGRMYIKQLRDNRKNLMALYQKFQSTKSAYKSLTVAIRIISENEEGRIRKEQSDELLKHLKLLAYNKNSFSLVEEYIPEGRKEEYWKAAKSQKANKQTRDLFQKVLSQFLDKIQKRPSRSLTEAVGSFHHLASEMRAECKETLSILAAITYALTQDEDEHQNLSEIVKRYRSEEYFALEEEML